jgi:hypothetical protein
MHFIKRRVKSNGITKSITALRLTGAGFLVFIFCTKSKVFLSKLLKTPVFPASA